MRELLTSMDQMLRAAAVFGWFFSRPLTSGLLTTALHC